MGKVLELSEEAYERLMGLAQQRQCTPEELIHAFLTDHEQALYYQANQQMLAQGILASIPRTACSIEAALTPIEILEFFDHTGHPDVSTRSLTLPGSVEVKYAGLCYTCASVFASGERW
jgi:hypothetical protein